MASAAPPRAGLTGSPPLSGFRGTAGSVDHASPRDIQQAPGSPPQARARSRYYRLGVEGLLAAAAALGPLPGGAVLNGQPQAPDACSTLRLYIDSTATDPGRDTKGICSSAVIGTRPLTLLTAGHCLKDVRTTGDAGLPAVRIGAAPSPAIAQSRLRAAVYPDFAEIERNVAEDLAILVFDIDATDELEALPLFVGATPASARVCGYGYGAREVDAGQPRCADKGLVSEVGEFARFVPRHYEALDPLLYLQFRVQFEAKEAAVSTLSALIAVNRLDGEGNYSLNVPMPVRGDSGGPWTVADEQGRPALLAITSFIETFYRKNKQWPIFIAHDTPLTDLPYVAYGVRLDTPEARSRIARARALGGDVRELRAKSAGGTPVGSGFASNPSPR